MAKQHLFSVTYWLLRAAMVLSVLVAAVLVLAVGALGLAILALGGIYVAGTGAGVLPFGMPPSVEGVPILEVLSLAEFAIGGGLMCAALLVLVFRAATGIVESAISGDPFVSDNARRLTHIGWLLLAVSVIQFLIQMIFALLVPEKLHGHFNAGSDLSPVGLLAILMIFVMAQIFRHGSEMRAELEGTV